MADGGCNNTAEGDFVELEAMRKDSFSWHSCQVSLCSEQLGLIVLYGKSYSEEIITDKEELLARIRVRSSPLEGDDCSSIKQGVHVLATHSSNVKGVFYDALVEKVIHVRHSKRIHCRCSFTIKWLHQGFEEEELTVPASSIMKLATKSIHLHPTISTFFSMLESSNAGDTMIVEGMNPEMDINVVLEKQINEISNSTDISKEEISKDFVFVCEVDLRGQNHGREIGGTLKDPDATVPLLNKLNGCNGSENKLPMETTLETPQAPFPSIDKEFTGSRLLLSPLAARAALASLRSEFPQSPDLSSQSNLEKGDITGELATDNLLYGSKCCSFSAVDRSSNTEDFSLKMSATGVKSPKFESIVKSLFPASSGMEKKKKIGEKKVTGPSKMLSTCAEIESNGISQIAQMTHTNQTQLRLTRRVTRSTVKGADKCNAPIDDDVDAECNKLDSPSRNIVAPQRCLSDNQKAGAPVMDGEANICSDEDDKSLLVKDGLVVKDDDQNGTFIQNTVKHNYPKRLTRSAARKETEENNVQPKLKVRKRSSGGSDELDLLKGNVSAETNALELGKSLTSPLAAKLDQQFDEEKEKNRKTSTLVKTTLKSSESGVCSHQKETRFSPRHGFLPRTRSQNKA